MNQMSARRDQPPMRGRVGVAEDGFLATSQYRTHPPPLTGKDRVADEIDLRKATNEPPDPQSVRDLLVTETERAELLMADRAVLSARERGDLVIQVVRW